MYKLLLVSLIALAPLAANATIQAKGDAFSPEKGLDLSGSFEVQRSELLEALGKGETYAEIAPADRVRVTEALDKISGLLAGAGSMEQLPEATRVEVFDQQEVVNTILTQAREDSRMICTREKKVGSHRATSSCKTVAGRRRLREETRDQLDTMHRFQMPASR